MKHTFYGNGDGDGDGDGSSDSKGSDGAISDACCSTSGGCGWRNSEKDTAEVRGTRTHAVRQ